MLIPKIWIDMEVKNSNGEIIQKTSEEGHSWVRNFYNLYATFMVDSSVLGTGLDVFDDANVKSGSGTPREYAGNTSTNNNYHFWRGIDAVGDGNGIRLGTSNEPFDIDDFGMPGVIQHGNGAGQLYHYAMPARTTSFDRNKWQLSVIFKRTFSNNSGDTIVIRETGMYSKGSYPSYSATTLMLRDVLATPVSIPHGALITCTYTLTSPEFLDVLKEPIYNVGDAGSGGYFFSRPGGLRTHLKYALVLAPIAGGLSTPLKWSLNTSNTIGATDEYYGYDNTQKLIAQGATSPIGQFVANANANKLGGYDDWYIPARYEYSGIATSFNPAAPLGEETPTGVYLWTSTEMLNSLSYRFEVNTNSGNSACDKSYTHQVRLVRRILHRNFIPKVED
jgi:hypothetical protein